MRAHGKMRCPGCYKHPKVCLCTGIEPQEIPVRLIIVQHPSEIWRPSNTAGLITRMFPRSCDLVVRGDPDGETKISKLLAEPNTRPYLVFPEPGAPEVGDLAAKGFSPDDRLVFVLIDGSWRQARRMRRRVEYLNTLPVVALHPAAPSTYRVRRQTRASNLSTAEAAALLLGRLAGLSGPHPALSKLFTEWIDRLLILRGIPRNPAMPSS